MDDERLDSYYAEYVSQRHEELEDIAKEAEAKEDEAKQSEEEAEQLAEYQRQMEESGRTYIQDTEEAMREEAEQEWQEELRYRESIANKK